MCAVNIGFTYWVHPTQVSPSAPGPNWSVLPVTTGSGTREPAEAGPPTERKVTSTAIDATLLRIMRGGPFSESGRGYSHAQPLLATEKAVRGPTRRRGAPRRRLVERRSDTARTTGRPARSPHPGPRT